MASYVSNAAYNGFSSSHFGSLNPYVDHSYDKRYGKQTAYFAPNYSAQSSYLPSFDHTEGYPIVPFDKARQSSLGVQFLSFMNQLDDQYRYEQYLRNLEKEQRKYLRDERSRMVSEMYTTSMNYDNVGVYEYERETRYVPYPIYITSSGSRPSRGGTLVYDPTPTTAYASTSALQWQTQVNMNLPPKVRVIFIPTGTPSIQQPCIGPLVSSSC
jgi:hypothetical protein